MKRIFILFAFLLTTGFAFAQQTQTAPAPTNEERAHTSALSFQKILTLTPEQTTQIEGIILSRINAIEVINADANKTPEQKQTEIAQIRKDKEQEILAVLTPEQLAKYNQLKEDRKKRKETIKEQEQN
ncbi:MAG: hypothetical protein L6Q81_01230 [Bacteroidia bacterium]|nr:hypothetical protein [Bacteroidia bacterium]